MNLLIKPGQSAAPLRVRSGGRFVFHSYNVVMPSREAIMDVLRTIPDPEMPLSIVDLGLVEEVRVSPASVSIDLLPTFIGCPALDMIAGSVRAKVGAMEGVGGVARVEVNWRFDPPWSVDRITQEGRRSLQQHGVTVPDRRGAGGLGAAPVPLTFSGGAPITSVAPAAPPIACPFCGSTSTRMESMFGPTRCRTIWYCDACRNSFEHLKRV